MGKLRASDVFKSVPPPESKSDATTRAAREITAKETKARNENIARLRKLRVARDAENKTGE